MKTLEDHPPIHNVAVDVVSECLQTDESLEIKEEHDDEMIITPDSVSDQELDNYLKNSPAKTDAQIVSFAIPNLRFCRKCLVMKTIPLYNQLHAVGVAQCIEANAVYVDEQSPIPCASHINQAAYARTSYTCDTVSHQIANI
ncbi:hypothetical protein HHI36_015211 [Cryptolaemus montrouzieri]|uniref:Uncharacterized protein n=1 Tax=Cryptolaemus montrouzieri TaxID=559131 RepID=A0ABD2N664_9CUCU